jgi:RHS repeat-associated protein
MESGAADLGILLPTGLESPLLPGLFTHEIVPGTSLNAVGSSTEPLSTLLSARLEAEQLEEERKRKAKEREEDASYSQLNPFSPSALGYSYGGTGFVGNAYLPELNADNRSSRVTVEASSQETGADSLTGTAPNQSLIPDNTTPTVNVQSEPVGGNVQPVVVSLPEPNPAPSIQSELGMGNGEPEQIDGTPLGWIDAPYPLEVVEKTLEDAQNPPPPPPAKVEPPIFWGYSPPVNKYEKKVDNQGKLVLQQGADLIFEKNLFENVGQSGQQNFKFAWESNDSILGRIQVKIDPKDKNSGVSGKEQSYIMGDNSRPPRLVFTGLDDLNKNGKQDSGEVSFSGNVLFGTYNRLVIDVVKDNKRVRYLLINENQPACIPCRAGDVIKELGAVSQSETLLNIPGRQGASSALDYSLTLEYRSDRITNGLVGDQWNHNNFERLERQIDGSIVHNNGLDRKDRYCPDEEMPGKYKAPPQFFTSLMENEDGTFMLRDADGTVKTFDANGNLTKIEDRNGNFVTLQYENGRLSKFIDTMGRAIDYQYINSGVNAGRLDKVVDFSDRVVDLTYDDNGDLVGITSPAVTTPDGSNDFPEGKTTNYVYSSGFADESLNHNLVKVIRPNEVAAFKDDPNQDEPVPVLEYEYGTSGFALDKVISKTEGGTNASGVQAGGTYTYQYELLATGALTGDPNQPISLFRETDRNGNITEYEFNPLGYTIAEREFTNRNVRPGEPDYETRYIYNADGRLLKQIDPEGNVMPYFYDESSNSRFAQGNLLVSRQLPGDRGGAQDEITTLSLYEPIYQQVSLSIDPRGTDPNFMPPILPDPSGRSQYERYSTRYFFDYQEAPEDQVLPKLAQKLGVSQDEVKELLEATGVTLGLGDINLDGVISTSIAGNVFAAVQPSVVLLPGSNQAEIEGDSLQDIFTLYRYNDFGQMTEMVDAEGNVHKYEYFAENDPDGNGITTPTPPDGRMLDGTTGGYLKEEIRDAEHEMIDGHDPNNGSEAVPTAISTKYKYDPVGNITSMTDGRGIRTDYVVNQLNQVVQTIRAKAVPDSGAGNPDEPLDLVAFAYIENVEYDANDNVVKRSIEDRGNTSNTGGFVEYEYTYDILDNLVTETQEVDVNTTLVTQYRYDANENLTFTLYPEGNATSAQYDERDLLFVSTRGAFKATADTLSPPDATNPDPDTRDERPYDVRGGIPCQCTTYNYDGNGNVIEMVDSDDTDQEDGNNGKIGATNEEGDITLFVYDGYDRQIATIDAVGNRTEVDYDPASNVIEQRVFGPIGGMSPVDNNGANNVLLSETLYQHDELNRVFQQDYTLFVADGVTTVRPPDIKDGSLTPNDKKVTTRTEYDRKSRVTFTIQDDENTYETLYDGADRQIETIDPEENTVEYAYDDNNNLIETQETDVAQIAGIADEVFLTTYFYDSLNRLQQTTDNLGQTMYYRYDSRDNLVAMADAQGPVTGKTIDRRAFLNGALTVNTINDFGNVTQYFYDGINRKVLEEQILTLSGEGDGVNIGATLEGVKTTTPTPDPNQGGGDGIIRTGYVYDDNSLLSALIDDQGNITLYLYDNLNRQVTETKGLVRTSPFTETFILGDRRVVTPTAATIDDPLFIPESQIQRQIDGAKSRIDKIAPLFPPLADDVAVSPPPPQATTIVYGYSPDDNVLILEDENDSETFTKYDAINRPIAVRVFRAGQTDSFIGDPIFAPNPKDDFDGPHRDTFPAVIGTNKNDYQYDGLSRLTRATDNNDPDDTSDDSVVTYAYDSLSRVIEETQQIGSLPVQATSSAWEADTRVGVTYPNGRELRYTYDGLDRIKAIAEDFILQPPLVEYDYIGVGRVLERRSPLNGTRLTYLNDDGNADIGYDGLRRTVQLRHLRDDDSLIVGFEYGYDRMNNRLFKRISHDLDNLNLNNSELYSYDSVYRLIDFQRGELNAEGDMIITPSPDANQRQEWDLDGVGNWDETTTTKGGVPTVEDRDHSSFNELIRRQDGVNEDLRYDDNGNLIEDGDYLYEWDSRNRLRRATRKEDMEDRVVGVYSYDAMGRRIRKEVTNSDGLDGVTDFYHDGNREIEERDVNNVLTQQYVYGNYIDEMLTMDRNLDGDNSAIGLDDGRFHYHQDALFSVYAVTDDTGQVAESYLYDPYGQVTVFDASGNPVTENVWETAHSAIGNPYLFTGRRFDEETGLYYFRARYYDADQGRFISRDPIGYVDGLNLYSTVSPTNMTDPFGLYGKEIHLDLTTDLSLMAGFIKRYAQNIGEWDNAIDDKYPPIALGILYYATYIVRPGIFGPWIRDYIGNLLSEWHFPGASETGVVVADSAAAQVKIIAARKICVIKDFAEGLHVFQDSFSHQGVPTFGRRRFGHGFTGEADDPHRPENRAIAQQMSKRSYEEIVKLLKDCSCLRLTRSSPERKRKHFASPDPYEAPDYKESQVSKYWELKLPDIKRPHLPDIKRPHLPDIKRPHLPDIKRP